MQREKRHIEHQLLTVDNRVPIGDIDGQGGVYLRLRPIGPLLGGTEAFFEITHRSKELIDLVAVSGTEGADHAFSIRGNDVHHAAALAETFNLTGLFGRSIGDEKLAKDL